MSCSRCRCDSMRPDLGAHLRRRGRAGRRRRAPRGGAASSATWLSITVSGLLISCERPIATSPSTASWSRRLSSETSFAKPIVPCSVSSLVVEDHAGDRDVELVAVLRDERGREVHDPAGAAVLGAAHGGHHAARLVDRRIELDDVAPDDLERASSRGSRARRRCSTGPCPRRRSRRRCREKPRSVVRGSPCPA